VNITAPVTLSRIDLLDRIGTAPLLQIREVDIGLQQVPAL